MKEMLNKINWDRVKYWLGHIIIILVLNTALWVYLIGSFVPYSKIAEFRLSWIDYLRLSDKVEWYHIWLLYIGIGVGILLSVLFIKGWINAIKQEKNKQEILEANKANTQAIIDAINKEQKKEQKEIDKYL